MTITICLINWFLLITSPMEANCNLVLDVLQVVPALVCVHIRVYNNLTSQLMFTAVLLMMVTCTLLGGLGGDNDSVVNSPSSLLLPFPYPFLATTRYWYRVLGRRCISRIMDWLVVIVNYS